MSDEPDDSDAMALAYSKWLGVGSLAPLTDDDLERAWYAGVAWHKDMLSSADLKRRFHEWLATYAPNGRESCWISDVQAAFKGGRDSRTSDVHKLVSKLAEMKGRKYE